MDEIRRLIKDYAAVVLRMLLGTLYLVLWILMQYVVKIVTDWLRPTGIDIHILLLFRIFSAIITLFPVIRTMVKLGGDIAAEIAIIKRRSDDGQ